MTRENSDRRQRRAEQISIEDARRISNDVWEIDCINDKGERRENLTIIPSEMYSPTKDIQYRGPKGIIGKYIRALAMHDDDARAQLISAINERRSSVQDEVRSLKEEEANLLHAKADLQDE